LATSWIEDERNNGLKITRDENETNGKREARVVYSDGRVTNYEWIESPTIDSNEKSNQSVVITCTNCPDYQKQLEPVAPTINNEETTSKEPKHSGTPSLSESVWNSLQRKSSDKLRGGHDSFEGFLTDDDQTSPIKVTVNRLGEVSNIHVGETSLGELAVGALTGNLDPCDDQTVTSDTDKALANRIHALSRGESACYEDAVLMVHLSEEMEQHTAGFSSSAFERHYSRGGIGEWLGRLQAGTLRYCNMPAGKTCDELENDLEMAHLSRCAYGLGRGHCNTRFMPADLPSLNLDRNDFHDNGFDAELFHDSANNRYVLAFRGTDSDQFHDPLNDDWDNNFNQARGLRARQYDLAVNLARDVLSELPAGSHLEFTGHSLGGGLATVAALTTRRQAHIFNAAALQPDSAFLYGVEAEYRNSDQYINHLHTRSDPLTTLQTLADDLDLSMPGRPPNSPSIVHDEIQSVHGRNTTIPNPDVPWVNEAHANASGFAEGLPWVIYHGIDAVLHSLQSLIDANCPPQTGSP